MFGSSLYVRKEFLKLLKVYFKKTFRSSEAVSKSFQVRLFADRFLATRSRLFSRREDALVQVRLLFFAHRQSPTELSDA